MANQNSIRTLCANGTDFKRSDMYSISPHSIVEQDGFNLRDYSDQDTIEHINNIAKTIADGGHIPPVVVWYDGGNVVLVDGHCRRRAALQAIDAGLVPQEYRLPAVLFKGDEIARTELMLRSDNGKKFTPLEVADGYLRLHNWGLSNADIAKRMNKSPTHVADYLALASAPIDIKQMVRSGEVAAQVAIEMLHKHPVAEAVSRLEALKSKAAAQGKQRVTNAQARAWLPKRELAADVIDAAILLSDSVAVDDLSAETEGKVRVDAALLRQLMEFADAAGAAKAAKEQRDKKRAEAKDDCHR